MNKFNISDIEKLDNALKKSAKTVIVTHMKPDGDAIGSTTALYHYVRNNIGAEVCIVLNDKAQQCLNFMLEKIGEESLIVFSENGPKATETIDSADTIICLDFNAFHRTDKL